MSTTHRSTGPPSARAHAGPGPDPVLAGSTAVELRKMFDTRSGFWLMASIAITAVLATAAVVLFAPDGEHRPTRPSRAAIGVPMAVILPIVAILSVTSEWSQRSGLTTFTLVPHRGRVILAKAHLRGRRSASPRSLLALAVGAVGNIVGLGARRRRHRVWDISVADAAEHRRSPNVLGLLVGFMLGRADPQLGRCDRGVLRLLVRAARRCPALLAASQDWFRDLQPWVDFNFAQGALFDGSLTGAAVGPARRHQPRLAGASRPPSASGW